MQIDRVKCKTIGGPSSDVACVFPFKFDGNTHYKCIWDESGAWCSTKVDANGNHVGGQGNWGNCGQGCPIMPKPTGM